MAKGNFFAQKNKKHTLMERIIKNPMVLPLSGMDEFIDAFRNDCYEIVTLDPVAEVMPESMIEKYKDARTHQQILGDREASFRVYAIKYTDNKGDNILFPIGIYGVSPNKKVCFPLLINGFWQAILMASKEAFSQFCNQDIDAYFLRFIEMKRKFMLTVFDYFKNVDPEFNAVMAWPSRGEKSNTRKVAEQLGFYRSDEGKMELYSREELTGSKLTSLSDCLLRWGILIDDREQYKVNVNYPEDKIKYLIQGLVGIQVPNTICS